MFSDAVLEAVARAVQLDDAERAHLLDLTQNANNASTPRRRRPSRPSVRPGMQRLMDAMTDAPTVVRRRRPRPHLRSLPLPADPGLTMTAYTAEPGSASRDALRLLASWAATVDNEEQSTHDSDPQETRLDEPS